MSRRGKPTALRLALTALDVVFAVEVPKDYPIALAEYGPGLIFSGARGSISRTSEAHSASPLLESERCSPEALIVRKCPPDPQGEPLAVGLLVSPCHF